MQGESVLQDLEAAEICGGPHAYDRHCRYHRATICALWRRSPHLQVLLFICRLLVFCDRRFILMQAFPTSSITDAELLMSGKVYGFIKAGG